MRTQFTELPETIDIDGFCVTARIERDDHMGPPWDEHEGHGPVSGWTSRDKLPGERILCSDGPCYRYYDVQEATRIARRDGWDAKPYGKGTIGQRAARAVDADFEYLRQWCANQWHWCGVVLAVSYRGVKLSDYAASLWGIESTATEYLIDVANRLINESLTLSRGCNDLSNA